MSEIDRSIDTIFEPDYWQLPTNSPVSQPLPSDYSPNSGHNWASLKVFHKNVSAAMEQWQSDDLPQLITPFRTGDLPLGAMVLYDVERLFDPAEQAEKRPGRVMDANYPGQISNRLNSRPQELVAEQIDRAAHNSRWLPVSKTIIGNGLEWPNYGEYVRECGVGQIITVNKEQVLRTPSYKRRSYDSQSRSKGARWLSFGPMAASAPGTTSQVEGPGGQKVLERINRLWLYSQSATDLRMLPNEEKPLTTREKLRVFQSAATFGRLAVRQSAD